MKTTFDSNLKLLRKDFNLTQPQLAKETNLCKSQICYWENGERTPNIKFVIILARYFQVSTDYLLKVTNDNTTIFRPDYLDVDLSIFSERLINLRVKKNLSQSQLSEKVKITQPAINYWENGKRIPNATAIVKLADFFGVTTDYLLGESD